MVSNCVLMAMNAKSRIAAKMGQKMEGIDGYVVAIVLGVVALVAGGVFKEQISTFVTTFFGQFTTRGNALF